MTCKAFTFPPLSRHRPHGCFINGSISVAGDTRQIKTSVTCGWGVGHQGSQVTQGMLANRAISSAFKAFIYSGHTTTHADVHTKS